jgi:5'-3' exonuclease
MSKRILIIDALNMFYRGYIVDPSISTHGEPIGGVKGFLKSLQKIVRETTPDEVVICWDGEGGSIRRKSINKDYKAGRKPIRLNRNVRNLTEDQEMHNKVWQHLKIIEYLNELPVIQICVPGMEADDIIGFIVKNSAIKENQKIIISSDKDFFQLCDSKTILIRPIQNEILNTVAITEKYNIHPENFALARAIEGDKSDNLSGIQGAGLKTIAKRFPFLLEEKSYTISDIIDHCVSQEKPLKIHTNILEGKRTIKENYRMMQLSVPTMSPDTIRQIEVKVKPDVREFNKTEILRMMIEDGMGEYNWTDLWANCNRIVWESKAPF